MTRSVGTSLVEGDHREVSLLLLLSRYWERRGAIVKLECKSYPYEGNTADHDRAQREFDRECDNYGISPEFRLQYAIKQYKGGVELFGPETIIEPKPFKFEALPENNNVPQRNGEDE
jgi:hypothetical protein